MNIYSSSPLLGVRSIPCSSARSSAPLKFAFRCGRPQKSRKNVKRKHYFQKFDAPVSHLRLLRQDFFLLEFSKNRSKTFHAVADVHKKVEKTSSENTFFKNGHSVADVPKKVEKTSSENTTFENSMRPYRTCGHRPEPLISGLPPLCLIYDPKPIVPLRTSLKKSKKRQAKTLLSKIRCARIALAALAALAA